MIGKTVIYEGERCRVIDWRDTICCFIYQGEQLWRDQSAVQIEKGVA